MKSLVFYKEKWYCFLQERLKKNPKIHYLQRAWRYRNDEDFVYQVMNINHNPDVMEIKRFGEKNIDSNIYFISLNGNMMKGLGGYLRQTLYGLIETDRLGFIPVIYYQPEGCLYAEEEEVNGSGNPFEYYFEQASNISVAEVYESSRVFLFNPAHESRIECDLGNLNPHMAEGYIVDDIYLGKLAIVFKKYIRLKTIVWERISEDMQVLCPDGWISKKFLGVHIRGTDYALNWLNHPNMVAVDEFVEAIDEVLEKYDYKYIFLATDDESRLDALKQKYGKKLIYYKEVARGKGALNIAMEKNDRPRHHYLSGYEVLRDMYTLAGCDSLICGLSQVAIMARIIRLASEQPYRYSKILDKGIYQG